MDEYHLDYETYSECNLKKLGQYRYACDPTTEILLCAVCRGNGPVLIWDAYASDEENAPALAMLMDISMDEEALVWAHNAPFEIAVSKYLWAKTFMCLPPAVNRWRCTAALCRVAAIPSSLSNAAAFLNIDDQKDKTGTALIKVFSVPQKLKKGAIKRTPMMSSKATVAGVKMPLPEAWQMFREYCHKDVLAERGVGERLKLLNLDGWCLEAFISDLEMNDRGIPVDTGALAKANIMIQEYEEKIGQRFTDTTGLSHTQRDKVFEWLRDRGYPALDLRANTVAEILGMDELEDDEDEEIDLTEDEDDEDAPLPPGYDISKMTPECYSALKDRALLSFAAIKKIKTMLAAACPDERIRGALVWYGAIRTGRSSSKIAQVHNMKRPTINTDSFAKLFGEPETHAVFRMIKDGSGSMDVFDQLFGPPFESVASAIRHFIGRNDGGKFLDIDLAQIEARVLAWLSGHHELLEAFRQGKDLYKITAVLLWGLVYEEVTKDERFLGKVAALACGYQGGVNAFLQMAKIYGAVIPEEKAKEVVKAYREGNAPIKNLWKDMQKCAVEAISTPGVWVPVNNKIKFGVSNKLGYPSLHMALPSGRVIQYPYPEIKLVYKIKNSKDDNKWVSIPEWRAKDAQGNKLDGVWITNEITYYGQIKQSSRWGRIKTHGGVFTENACQAVAGDFLTHGVLQSEKAGYSPVFSVHDQGIFWYQPERGNSVEGLVKAFTTVPAWAPGFPLGAEAAVTDFYTK